MCEACMLAAGWRSMIPSLLMIKQVEVFASERKRERSSREVCVVFNFRPNLVSASRPTAVKPEQSASGAERSNHVIGTSASAKLRRSAKRRYEPFYTVTPPKLEQGNCTMHKLTK